MTTLEAEEWRDGGEKRERRWNWEKRFFFFCPFLLDFARDDFEKNDARSTSSTSTSLVSLDLNLDHHHHKKNRCSSRPTTSPSRSSRSPHGQRSKPCAHRSSRMSRCEFGERELEFFFFLMTMMIKTKDFPFPLLSHLRIFFLSLSQPTIRPCRMSG